MALYTGVPPIVAIYVGSIPVIGQAVTPTGPQYFDDFPDLSYENNIDAITYDASQHFSGADGGTWSLVVTPFQGGVSINSATGVLTIEPLPLPEGSWTLTVTVDVGGQTASGSANLTITPDTSPDVTPDAPSYDGMAEDLNLTSGQAMSAVDMSQYFSGADLAYSASGSPTGISINSTSGSVTGTPTQTGTFSASVTATNGGGTATASFTITVS